jgi:hypothetical protein
LERSYRGNLDEESNDTGGVNRTVDLVDKRLSREFEVLTVLPSRVWLPAFAELVARLMPKHRPRANPRVIKHTYIRQHTERSRHRDWPQHDGRGIDAVRISN